MASALHTSARTARDGGPYRFFNSHDIVVSYQKERKQMETLHGRREFLKLKSAGRLVASLSGGEWPGESRTEAGEGSLYRIGRKAMATRFEILVNTFDSGKIPVCKSALDEIDLLEDQLSVYRDTSELSRINRDAHQEPVPVEENLFHLFQECKNLWLETDGCFDIAVHRLLEAWGLFRGPQKLPSEIEIEQALECSSFDEVCLDRDKQTVRFKRPGVGINLGAIGKGYALDRTSEILESAGLSNFLIHGGNSSILASGSSSWQGDGWLIGLAHPLDQTRIIARVQLADKAVSTSALRPGAIMGSDLPHVLDPRRGRPLQTDLVSVSVFCSSAREAEALSTAFLVMGVDEAEAFCESREDLGAVFLLNATNGCGDLVSVGLSEGVLEEVL